MNLPLARIRELVAACDPGKPIKPEDSRYCDLDGIGSSASLRGARRWSDRLSNAVLMAPAAVTLYASGLPGSGKSTELTRVRRQLEAEGHLVVMVDAESVVDLGTPIDLTEVLVAVVEFVEGAVLGLEGKDPEAALQDSWSTRFWHWLRSTEVTIKGADVNATVGANVKALAKAEAGAKLSVELRERPSFREEIRQVVAARPSSFVAEVNAHLSTLRERARKKGREQVCVIFDGLEKLSGMHETWDAVRLSAVTLFRQNKHYLQFPDVDAIFMVPPWLRLETDLGASFLPVVRIRHRDGRPDETGIAALRTLLRRRIGDDELAIVLGPERSEEWARRIIVASGGYIRGLLAVLAEILVNAREAPVRESVIEAILADRNEAVRLVVRAEDLSILRHVHATQSLEKLCEEDVPRAARLVANSVLFRYENGDGWWGLHPAIVEMLEAPRTDGTP